MEYEEVDYRTYRRDNDGNTELMANFIGRITEECHYIDGMSTTTELTMEGSMPGIDAKTTQLIEVKLPPVRIKAEDFPGMAWVLPSWGVRAVIRPGTSMKDDLRAAIQLNSKPTVKTVYRHIGWAEDKGPARYIHAGGAMKKGGNDPHVSSLLPPELRRFDLTTDLKPEVGLAATLALVDLAPPAVTFPLIAGTLTPIFGPVDFAMHVTGRTGTFKSELMSLMQSHYGPTMDARRLPGSWSSTANALEAQAYLCKNAAFVVDDFIPSGTSWQVRAYQATADKILRAQGNQAGRARLTDVSALQTTMYPRGIILSTGEDTPEGHSVRARMYIMELSPGDIEVKNLSAAQARRAEYVATVAGLTRYLAGNIPILAGFKDEVEEERKHWLGVGHSRTPSMLARIAVTWRRLMEWAKELGYKKRQTDAIYEAARKWIRESGERQQTYLEEADPVDIFTAAIRQALSAGIGHFRTKTGAVPRTPELLGWTKESSGNDDEMPLFKARGQTMGWVSWDKNTLYLDVNTGYAVIKKVSGSEISITKQTMLRRLKDAAVLTESDEIRQRNTVRITAEGHGRTVVALSLSKTLEQNEVKDE